MWQPTLPNSKNVVIQAIIDGHVIGISKYLGLKKKGEGSQVNNDNKVAVLVNGKRVADGVLDNGTTYTPARAVAVALGASVTYDAASKIVNITKK